MNYEFLSITTKKNIHLVKGKFGRKVLRNKIKKAIVENKGNNESMLGKLTPRQNRKKRAKDLKIPFNPKYNGPVYLAISELKTNEKGYLVRNLKELKKLA